MVMEKEVADAIFALTAAQHMTIKTVASIMVAVTKSASEEDARDISEHLGRALDALDAAIAKTRIVIDRAHKNG